MEQTSSEAEKRDKENNAMRPKTNAIYKNTAEGGTKIKAEYTDRKRAVMEKETRTTSEDEKRNSVVRAGLNENHPVGADSRA